MVMTGAALVCIGDGVCNDVIITDGSRVVEPDADEETRGVVLDARYPTIEGVAKIPLLPKPTKEV